MLCGNDMPPPFISHPLILFVNPLSGGGFGLDVVKALHGVEQVFVVQLPLEEGTWFAKHEAIVHNPNLRYCVAGGDGSVNWVATMLHKCYPEFEGFRPPLAVIPLGTGNDMSQALGWGAGLTSNGLAKIGRTIESIAVSDHISQVDIWEVSIIRTDTSEAVIRSMTNYISFGVSAEITHSFQDIRAVCQPYIMCQCMIKSLFVPAGFPHVFGKRDLSEYMRIDLEGASGWRDEWSRMKTECGDKTVTFTSTPTIYGGRQLWTGEEPVQMNDGKLEVCVEGGLFHVMLTNVGINSAKSYAQVEGVSIETTEPCVYQIDGEAAVINGPAITTVKKVGSYPFVFAQ